MPQGHISVKYPSDSGTEKVLLGALQNDMDNLNPSIDQQKQLLAKLLLQIPTAEVSQLVTSRGKNNHLWVYNTSDKKKVLLYQEPEQTNSFIIVGILPVQTEEEKAKYNKALLLWESAWALTEDAKIEGDYWNKHYN